MFGSQSTLEIFSVDPSTHQHTDTQTRGGEREILTTHTRTPSPRLETLLPMVREVESAPMVRLHLLAGNHSQICLLGGRG